MNCLVQVTYHIKIRNLTKIFSLLFALSGNEKTIVSDNLEGHWVIVSIDILELICTFPMESFNTIKQQC